MSDTFLVTGGTGKVGATFAALLAADARAPIVRVATRDPASKSSRLVAALNPATIQPVAFDVDREDTLRAAFAGVTKLFVIAPFVAEMAAWHEKVAAAAKQAGTVDFVVKLSVTGARGPGGDSPPGRLPLSHWQGEEALRQAGLHGTMIRPTIFMQHFTMATGMYTARGDRLYLPTGDAKVAWLDCRDIATMAAALLTASPEARAPFDGGAYELTGPRAHTAAELAEIVSLVARRQVKHVDGMDAFSSRCRELGKPDGIKGIYNEAAGGWFGKVDHDAFTRLTGRTTTSFAKFAIDHAPLFTDGGDA